MYNVLIFSSLTALIILRVTLDYMNPVIDIRMYNFVSCSCKNDEQIKIHDTIHASCSDLGAVQKYRLFSELFHVSKDKFHMQVSVELT